MAEPAVNPLTFDEFVDLNLDGRWELVNGRLDELVSPGLRHSWTGGKIAVALDPYLEEHEPDAYWGVELDIPTIPYFGRRPDFVYYSAADAASGLDEDRNRVTGVPTLAAEVLSEDDEARDLVTKRREYARAGIPHYWILDPKRQTVLALRLGAGEYEVVGELGAGDVLTSELFPGWQIPVRRLFRQRPRKS